MRGLRDVERWSAALKHFPLAAHWADGTPLDDSVAVMAKIEDRVRRYVVDGNPVVTGIVPVADAWACTNPSVGRGMTIGLIHAVALRDLLRRDAGDDPVAFARAWDAATADSAEPWFRATREFDRHRLAEAEAESRNESYATDDVAWEMGHALMSAAGKDPDALRGALSIAGMTRSAEEVFGVPGFAEKVMALGGGWRDDPLTGPTRDELVAVVAA
jgi:hypothetical protein